MRLIRLLMPALVLVGAMVFLVPGLASASYTQADQADAIEFVGGLDIMHGWGGQFHENEYFTREQLATVVVRIKNLQSAADAAEGAVADMYVDAPPASHWSSKYLLVAYVNDLMRGSSTSEGRFFYPGEDATLDHVLTILIRALGFELSGPWPDVYRNKAVDLGLLTTPETQSGNLPATRGAIARLIYVALSETDEGKALAADLVNVGGFTYILPNYDEILENHTLLWGVWDIRYLVDDSHRTFSMTVQLTDAEGNPVPAADWTVQWFMSGHGIYTRKDETTCALGRATATVIGASDSVGMGIHVESPPDTTYGAYMSAFSIQFRFTKLPTRVRLSMDHTSDPDPDLTMWDSVVEAGDFIDVYAYPQRWVGGQWQMVEDVAFRIEATPGEGVREGEEVAYDVTDAWPAELAAKSQKAGVLTLTATVLNLMDPMASSRNLVIVKGPRERVDIVNLDGYDRDEAVVGEIYRLALDLVDDGGNQVPWDESVPLMVGVEVVGGDARLRLTSGSPDVTRLELPIVEGTSRVECYMIVTGPNLFELGAMINRFYNFSDPGTVPWP